MNALNFSRAAQADLMAIGRYTEREWGRKQRDVYLDALFSVFEKLRENPLMGRGRDELYRDMGSFHIERHVVFYFFKKKQVTIVGVLHERMDPQRHLKP